MGATAKQTDSAGENQQINGRPMRQEVAPGTAAVGMQEKTQHGASASENGESIVVSKIAYIEVINKRMRNLMKKKQRIEQTEVKPVETLNKDQKAVLASKDAVLSALKEYQEIAKHFKIIEQEQSKQLEAERNKEKALIEDKANERFEQGKLAGRSEVLSLVRFLRHASWLRQNRTEKPAEDGAIENLLFLVYEGRQKSVDVVKKLHDGCEEVVEGSEAVTFAKIKELVDEQAGLFEENTPSPPNENLAEQDSVAMSERQAELASPGQEPFDTSNTAAQFCSSSRLPRGGINFFVESEIMTETSQQHLTDGTIQTMSTDNHVSDARTVPDVTSAASKNGSITHHEQSPQIQQSRGFNGTSTDWDLATQQTSPDSLGNETNTDIGRNWDVDEIVQPRSSATFPITNQYFEPPANKPGNGLEWNTQSKPQRDRGRGGKKPNWWQRGDGNGGCRGRGVGHRSMLQQTQNI